MSNEVEAIKLVGIETPVADEQTTLRARKALMLAIDGEMTSSRNSDRRWPSRLMIALAAALALSLLLPILIANQGGGTARAGDFLNGQAVVAAGRASLWPIRSGQFLYQERTEWNRECHVSSDGSINGCTSGRVGAFEHQIWVAADGSGRECLAGLKEAAGDGCGLDTAGTLTPMDLSDLPTDPQEILSMAAAGTLPGERDGTSEAAGASILRLLVEPTASSDLRAALYQAAAMSSGIRLVGQAQDELGRTGIALSITTPGGTRLQVLFDPSTSLVLEERTEQATADPQSPEIPLGVTGWVVYHQALIVQGANLTTSAGAGRS